MKILDLSDSQLEFIQMEIPRTDADIVVLSRDIAKSNNPIEWAVSFTQQVVVIIGNHEAYGTVPVSGFTLIM